MKQFFGMSQHGDLKEAARGVTRPQFIMLLSNGDQFEAHVKELERIFPRVPSIGCIGMSYDTKIVEHGVGVIAFLNGVQPRRTYWSRYLLCRLSILRDLSGMYSRSALHRTIRCALIFASGNDACVLTTINTVLKHKKISLVGGTGDGGKVSANGKIYSDAVAYALVKNKNGKVKAYKENIYHQMKDYRFIASQTDKSRYLIGALNGQPAKRVYRDILHISDEDVQSQTLRILLEAEWE